LKYFLILLICTPLYTLLAQEEDALIEVVDSLYREDQFYVGVTFNLLANQPSGVSQNGFSGSFQAGFIRDMPINKNRTKAIGVGLGIAADTFNHNLFIGEEVDGETTIFQVITSDINEDRNRFSYYSAELPIEYRWRTSTPTKYAFWRIHAGVRLGYIFRFKSTFEQTANTVIQTEVPELNELQYGLTLSFGYGAFNFQGYYGLNTLFNDDALISREEAVNLQVVRLGLQFFFL
jgi:hypothetical protein